MKRVTQRPLLGRPLQSWSLIGLLCAASLLTRAPAEAEEGGPDAAGYIWADTTSGGPAFDYEYNAQATLVPLGTRGTSGTNGTDDSYATVGIGFSFPFYGASYTQIDIHSNGGLTFGAGAALPFEHDCAAISPAVPTILPYWVDLFPGGATAQGTGIWYWAAGDAPNRYLVVEWYKIALYRDDGNYSASDLLTFEAKLFEDGRIEFHYDDLNGDSSNDDGAKAAVLIAGTPPQATTPSILTVSCDSQAFLSSELAIGLTPPVCPDDDEDGLTTCAGDCDDTNADIYPGAIELCDGRDNNCDSVLPSTEVDFDEDGWLVCEDDCDDTDAALTPADQDGDGQSSCDGDCDDDDPKVSSNDVDGDGLSACEGDCNDHNNTVRPGNGELCDGLDNDCDGEIDDNPNCESRGGDTGPGHDIAYGCIMSCNQGSEGSGHGGLALLSLLLGAVGLARRRRTSL